MSSFAVAAEKTTKKSKTKKSSVATDIKQAFRDGENNLNQAAKESKFLDDVANKTNEAGAELTKGVKKLTKKTNSKSTGSSNSR